METYLMFSFAPNDVKLIVGPINQATVNQAPVVALV
jgi:hypothetical protein